MNGSVRAAWIQEVAKLFEVELKASQCKAQRAVKVVQIEPPSTIALPAPIAIVAATPLTTCEPTSPRIDGRVPVRKTILHRGRSFAVTYWVKQSSAAA
jgi:hypothetical protein